MVKCLIRIKTKVNVHLRMINHCYRDVKVRVLSLGPRLMGKALGILPLFPALPEGSSSSDSAPGSGQSSRTPSRLAVPPQIHGCVPPANRAGKNWGWLRHAVETAGLSWTTVSWRIVSAERTLFLPIMFTLRLELPLARILFPHGVHEERTESVSHDKLTIKYTWE